MAGIAGALGAALGAAGINTGGNILNGQNSVYRSDGSNIGSSWGSSANSAWSNANSWSKSYGYSDSLGYSNDFSESSGWSDSYNRTFGREASAQDIQNAYEANQVQKDLWSMQADYNAKQAQIDRDFQEDMSNTAYQRAVLDLLAAGLNPILAVGNMGASTPVGAMASSGLGTAAKANAYAESEGYSSSASSSYSRGESYNKSHSEQKSKSKSKERSRSSGSSSQGSEYSSSERTRSSTKTQLKDLVGAVADLIEGGSAKNRGNGGGAW